MLIVPEADDLTVEARVPPQNIDQLILGQAATLRFSTFNQRTTPEINGIVSRISADIATDQRTSAAYYVVRGDDAGGGDRAPRRGEARAWDAGGDVHSDGRQDRAVLPREAAARPDREGVPGKIANAAFRTSVTSRRATSNGLWFGAIKVLSLSATARGHLICSSATCVDRSDPARTHVLDLGDQQFLGFALIGVAANPDDPAKGRPFLAILLHDHNQQLCAYTRIAGGPLGWGPQCDPSTLCFVMPCLLRAAKSRKAWYHRRRGMRDLSKVAPDIAGHA